MNINQFAVSEYVIDKSTLVLYGEQKQQIK